jgi:hypothetical protein
MRVSRIIHATLLGALAAGAQAQTPAPTPTPAVSSELEPAVQTSHPDSTAPSPAANEPASGASNSGKAPPRPAADVSASHAKPADRIELGTTQISGNRELPKVMYVVPWRRPDLGDMSGRPQGSLLDEALTPVDRDVFRRQNRYYAALESGAAAARTPPARESQDEK